MQYRDMCEGRLVAEEESKWSLRNWRVRARLVALILIPTAAAVLLGVLQVLGSATAASAYAGTSRLAALVAETGTLAHGLETERARVARYIATGRPQDGREALTRQTAVVDAAARGFRAQAARLGGELTGRTASEVTTALARLADLAAVRSQAIQGGMPPDAAVDLYTAVIDDLLTLYDEVSKGVADEPLLRQARLLHALALAKESFSRQQALLTVVLVAGRFEQGQLTQVLGELAGEQNARAAFAEEATVAERRALAETADSDRAFALRGLMLTRAASGSALTGPDLTGDVDVWFDSAATVVEAMRTLESTHAVRIVGRAEELNAVERRWALVVAGAVLALLAAVLLATACVARSLVRPLRRLRSEALEVAGRRLPEVVQRLRENQREEEADVPLISVSSRDEVGEVARAFDEVHREAVRLAGEEARLRANVNAIFVNLSRRTQALVERQLTLIERLERGERDDARLGDLFRLDHLATRMRRNSENLLVLAGQEPMRKWTNPVELLDVVRAAVGEVEGYDRVSLRIQSATSVVGQAVNDVVHLLAELVENAVAFSRHDAKVQVSSSRVEGGLLLSVTDQGIGMAAAELDQANRRLAHPPLADVSVARRMGLFVVGRLALRHGVRVQLRQHGSGGLTAMVLLPERMLTEAAGPLPPSRGTAGAVTGPFLGGHPSFDTPSPVERAAEAGRPAEPVESALLSPLAAPEPPAVPEPPVASESPAASEPPVASEPPEPLELPAPRSSPAEEQPESWFTRPSPSSPGAPRAAAPLAGVPGGVTPPTRTDGVTPAGLPRRTPRANLMPGSVASSSAPARLPPVGPDQLRDRLATFQRGVRKGRAEIEEESG